MTLTVNITKKARFNMNIFRAVRVFSSYTMGEMCGKLGVSVGYLSEIETGKKKPSMALIEKYAEIFETRPAVIVALMEPVRGNKFVRRIRKAALRIMNDMAKFEV